MGPHPDASPANALAPVLLGVLAGAACQLQQPELFTLQVYAVATAGAGLVLLVGMRWSTASPWRGLVLLLTALALSAATTGWRAAAYAADDLDPALEGRDVVVTGVVAAMPQRSDLGLRFRFEVDGA
ncbi:MAG: DUF4131 domain-containing protein, partial [Ramlibacter sp.]